MIILFLTIIFIFLEPDAGKEVKAADKELKKNLRNIFKNMQDTAKDISREIWRCYPQEFNNGKLIYELFL